MTPTETARASQHHLEGLRSPTGNTEESQVHVAAALATAAMLLVSACTTPGETPAPGGDTRPRRSSGDMSDDLPGLGNPYFETSTKGAEAQLLTWASQPSWSAPPSCRRRAGSASDRTSRRWTRSSANQTALATPSRTRAAGIRSSHSLDALTCHDRCTRPPQRHRQSPLRWLWTSRWSWRNRHPVGHRKRDQPEPDRPHEADLAANHRHHAG